MKKLSRFLIGIDLGTTSTSLSFIDTLDESQKVQQLPITQWEDKGQLIKKELLPSFCYLTTKKEIRDESFKLPFYEKTTLADNKLVIGRYALEIQKEQTSRVIHSAKSWLCHLGVNREDKILPWHSDEIVGEARYSPVEVLSSYLLHLRLNWNEVQAKHEDSYKLELQRVVITVPASFDEVASSLTLKAAHLAGYFEENTSLIEEPQAAFYSWLYENQNASFFKNLEGQKKLLVCDIGGGTSDFSLFKIEKNEHKNLFVERTKVSPHILLGGDNIDLKIASLFEEKNEKKLSSNQWSFLVNQSRRVKESILSQKQENEKIYVSLPSASGKKNLFETTLTLSLEQEEIKAKLLKSFFPNCQKNFKAESEKPLALSDFGLPYAKDPAFSHHLSEFLDGQEIDAVLFVGGSLIPNFLRNRFLEILHSWQEKKILALNDAVDPLCVSKGAAIFANTERNPKSLCITSGYPRSLYLEIQKSNFESSLLCLIPKGYQERKFLNPSENLNLTLTVNQDICLTLYSSNLRPQDNFGDLIAFDKKEEFKKLAPIQTKIVIPGKKNSTLPVYLESGLTETGILKIFCCEKNGEKKWEFIFNISEQKNLKFETTNLSEFMLKEPSSSDLLKAKELLLFYFGKSKNGNSEISRPKASHILSELESTLHQKKQDWSLQTLRELASCLIETKNSRTRNGIHESAWLNLCGYFMRPGYGHPLDSSKISELETIFDQGVQNSETSQVHNEWWVFWRRLSGGLSKELQRRIFSKVSPKLRTDDTNPEMILTLGSLELVDPNKKALLLNKLSEDIGKIGTNFVDQKLWTLTHISSRTLLYSGPENIIRPTFLEESLEKISEIPEKLKKKHKEAFTRFYLHSSRIVNDREFDLSEESREKIIEQLSKIGASKDITLPLRKFVPMKHEEKKELHGDSLPLGLSLR